MAAKRIIYALIALAAVAALVITDSGIALYLCVIVIVLPLLSFCMLMFAGKRIRFACDVQSSCMRGGALKITMRAGLAPRVLAGYARIAVTVINTTFGKVEEMSFLFNDLSYAPHSYDYVSADSGRIVVRFTELRLVDFFGVFSIRIKRSEYCEAVVSPILYDDLFLRLGTDSARTIFGEMALPQKGMDVSEIFNIRDYVAGDAMSAVHWKLSGKFDALKSKEFGCTDDNRLLLLVDMSKRKIDTPATDAQLNAVLDIAISISDALKSGGYEHNLGWINGGMLERAEVTDADSLVRATGKLMSIKVHAGNANALYCLSRCDEAPAFTKIIYITPVLRADEPKHMSGVDLTVISPGADVGVVEENGIRIIKVPVERMADVLSGCAI